MSKEKRKAPEAKNHEEVLVVKREVLFPQGSHEGLQEEGLEKILEIILGNAQFLPRWQVEEDPSWKQIIPYLVFTHGEKLFLMQRIENHAEKRLSNLFSLGIGGHLRENEFVGQDILTWAKREFEEEVNYQGEFQVQPLGLLNCEETPVDAVHTGLVLLLQGDSPQIRIKDEHQSGRLATLEECAQVYGQMENWSKIVFEALKKKYG